MIFRYKKDDLVSKSPLNSLPKDLLLITGNSPTDVRTFVLDADTIPRTITWITTIGQKNGSPSRWIYDLMGDRLILVTTDPFKP